MARGRCTHALGKEGAAGDARNGQLQLLLEGGRQAFARVEGTAGSCEHDGLGAITTRSRAFEHPAHLGFLPHDTSRRLTPGYRLLEYLP
jgi:hypothetical protein